MKKIKTLSSKAQAGFTLLELMIAMLIVSFIAIFTSTSITSVAKTKKKIQGIIDESAEVRSVLKIIKRDLAKAFNYRDVHIRIYNEAMKERIIRAENSDKKNTDSKPGTTPPANGGTDGTGGANPGAAGKTETLTDGQKKAEKLREKFIPREDKLLTKFIGTEDELHFSTLSYIKFKEDAKVSAQAEVSYLLKTCTSRFIKGQQSKCLFRRITPTIDQEIQEGGEETVILENVTEFKLKYLSFQLEEVEWLEDWDSEKQAINSFPVFPDAVEITIEVKRSNGKKDKTFSMTRYAPIFFANRPPKDLKPFRLKETNSGTPPPPTPGP